MILVIVVNRFLVGLPSWDGRNALHRACTCLVSGLLAGFAAFFVHQLRAARTGPDTLRRAPLSVAVKAALLGGVVEAGSTMIPTLPPRTCNGEDAAPWHSSGLSLILLVGMPECTRARARKHV